MPARAPWWSRRPCPRRDVVPRAPAHRPAPQPPRPSSERGVGAVLPSRRRDLEPVAVARAGPARRCGLRSGVPRRPARRRRAARSSSWPAEWFACDGTPRRTCGPDPRSTAPAVPALSSSRVVSFVGSLCAFPCPSCAALRGSVSARPPHPRLKIPAPGRARVDWAECHVCG